MPAAAAISLSAIAVSSAWLRLSSAQGPAMTASGRALPKCTFPTATIGLAGGSTFDIQPTMKPADRPVNRSATADERSIAVVAPGAVSLVLMGLFWPKELGSFGPRGPSIQHIGWA